MLRTFGHVDGAHLQTRPFKAHLKLARRFGCTCRAQAPQQQGVSYSSEEKVIDISSLLAEVRQESDDFIFTDDNYDEPVWEHEHRIRSKPMTMEELQQEPPPLFAPAATSVEQVLSAYSSEAGFKQLSVDELAIALQAGDMIDLLLDVRTPEEFEAGPVIAGAVNVPLDKLSDTVRAGDLDPYIDGQIAVVCASGQRSSQATVRLTKMFGFKHVSNVEGGMSAWVALQQGSPNGGSGGCGCGSPSGGCGSH